MKSLKELGQIIFAFLALISYEVVYPIIGGYILIHIFGEFPKDQDWSIKVILCFLVFFIFRRISKAGSRDSSKELHTKLDFIISKLDATEEFNKYEKNLRDEDGKLHKDNELKKMLTETAVAVIFAGYIIYLFVTRS